MQEEIIYALFPSPACWEKKYLFSFSQEVGEGLLRGSVPLRVRDDIYLCRVPNADESILKIRAIAPLDNIHFVVTPHLLRGLEQNINLLARFI